MDRVSESDRESDTKYHMPVELIDGIKACLKSGMSYEQITAVLGVVSGIMKVCHFYAPVEFRERVAEITRVCEGLHWLENVQRGDYHGEVEIEVSDRGRTKGPG